MASSPPPIEIITDILLRLPLKSLLRSKSVAKSWYTLITSPHFIKLHLHLPSPTTTLILASSSSPTLQILSSTSLTPLLTLPHPLPSSSSIISSLHGLICLFSRSTLQFALLNPATRLSNIVARSPPVDPRTKLCNGFGYDSVTDQYWIVQVGSCPVSKDRFMRSVRVWWLGGREWSVVSEEICEEVVGEHCGVVDGRMHWVEVKPRNRKGRIVSYDVGRGRFGEVEMPSCYGSQVHYPREVGEIDGRLCFLTEANRGGVLVYIDVWVMKEYGNEDSWGKMYSVWCLEMPYPVLSVDRGNKVLYCQEGSLCWFYRCEQMKDRPDLNGVALFSEAVVSVASIVPVSFAE